jgi:hypothetical protein
LENGEAALCGSAVPMNFDGFQLADLPMSLDERVGGSLACADAGRHE